MKTCAKCGEIKQLCEFHNSKVNKDGKNGSCKECINAQSKNYALNNKLKIAKNHKEWHLKNKEKANAVSMQWRKENPEAAKVIADKSQAKYRAANKEKIAKYKRKWHLNNRSKVAKNNKERYLNNKSKVTKKHKEWRKNNPERDLEIRKRKKAKRERDLGFIPLNKKFDGADGHHIDKQHVVYIPKELHMSIPHKQTDKKSMEKINELAFNWMLGEQ